jgi:chromosome segregation ATPase
LKTRFSELDKQIFEKEIQTISDKELDMKAIRATIKETKHELGKYSDRGATQELAIFEKTRKDAVIQVALDEAKRLELVDKLTAAKSDLAEKINQLNAHIEEMGLLYGKKLGKARTKATLLEKNHLEAQKVVSDIQKEVSGLDAQKMTTQASLDEVNTQIEKLNKDVQQREALSKKLVDLSSKQKETVNELQDAMNDLVAKQESLAQDKENLKGVITSQEERIQSHSNNLNELEDQIRKDTNDYEYVKFDHYVADSARRRTAANAEWAKSEHDQMLKALKDYKYVPVSLEEAGAAQTSFRNRLRKISNWWRGSTPKRAMEEPLI